MNKQGRLEVAKKVFDRVTWLLDNKGADYGNTEDANANFKETAKKFGISPFQVWGMLVDKHVIAINNAIKRNPDNPQRIAESIEESIIDVVTYEVILLTLLKDLEGEVK